MIDLKIDETWYVKLPKSESLDVVDIVNLTALTVELRVHDIFGGVCTIYEKADIKFVEKRK